MSPPQVRVFSPAKINLFLDVLGKRPDGYHEIATIFQEIGIGDELTVASAAQEGIFFTCSDPALPQGSANLAVRAALYMKEKFGERGGLKIHLEKKIPAGSGLGGGSSNAAAVLWAVNQLWSLGLGPPELMKEAALLGSDCAFFILGGTALGTGRGEVLRPVEILPLKELVVVCPDIHCSTAEVYAALNLPLQEPCSRIDSTLAQLRSSEIDRVRGAFFNRLEDVALRLKPELLGFRDELLRCGMLQPRLTGSGSAFFSVFSTRGEAEDRLRAIGKSLDRKVRGIFCTSFCQGGVRLQLTA